MRVHPTNQPAPTIQRQPRPGPIIIRDEIILHRDFCEAHFADDHWLSQDGTCFGNDRSEAEKTSLEMYYYSGHKGNGNYSYRLRYEYTRLPTMQETFFDYLTKQHDNAE